MKYDFNKCTKEQLVCLMDLYNSHMVYLMDLYHSQNKSVEFAIHLKNVQMTAEVKLRTRAEVDADIAKAVRAYCGGHDGWSGVTSQLRKLVDEETQD